MTALPLPFSFFVVSFLGDEEVDESDADEVEDEADNEDGIEALLGPGGGGRLANSIRADSDIAACSSSDLRLAIVTCFPSFRPQVKNHKRRKEMTYINSTVT
jgi:hypothetical protein